jgi:hypothetical protein
MSTNNTVDFPTVELPSKYAKAIVAIITAVLTVLIAALGDGKVSDVELVNIVVAFLVALGVYLIPNIKDQTVGGWLKAIIAFIGTGLQALIPFLANGHVTNAQWLMVVLAAIGTLAVGIVPNVDPLAKIVAQAAIPSAVNVVGGPVQAQVTMTGGANLAQEPPA